MPAQHRLPLVTLTGPRRVVSVSPVASVASLSVGISGMQLQPSGRSGVVGCPRVRPDGEPADVGTIISLPDPRLLELAALAGSQWIFLDCEHGSVAPSDLGRVLAGGPEDV